MVLLCVCLTPSLPYVVNTSGELIQWDLTRTGKQKWTLLGSSPDGQNHSRIVFNLSSVCLGENREVLVSTSMDREVGAPGTFRKATGTWLRGNAQYCGKSLGHT